MTIKLYRAHKFSTEATSTGIFDNPYLEVARRPVTMPLPVHHACDDWFSQRFQVNFRSRAIFATGSPSQAMAHMGNGSVILRIWPIGEYKLCYSPYVYDLFDHFSTRFSGHLSSELVASELDELGYRFSKNAGLHEAASSGCEVMLVADSFGYEVQGDEL